MSTLPTTSIIIFGASGDLTHRKLVPALYNNLVKQRLPGNTQIIGFSRSKFSHPEFRNSLHTALKEHSPDSYDEAIWETFSQNIHYISGNFNDVTSYKKLDSFLKTIEEEESNRLYYFATAPGFFSTIAEQLGQCGMNTEESGGKNWRRIIVEKPFGSDLATAQQLNNELHQFFNESQIYRIDHYLGKETSQNIMFFRFANTIFEPIWNRQYISNVQVTVAESLDVGSRGSYYDKSGVLRDMFQNHLFQLLSLIAMEPPASFGADTIRNEKVKVFHSARPLKLENTVYAQYEGYRETEGVSENSTTPTYAAIKMYIDNWRWQGVPFYLRSGKSLKRKTSEIIIEFQRPPHLLFDMLEGETIPPNILALCLQPDEGIHLRFEAKVPDSYQETQSVDMEFHYTDSFQGIVLPEAYERLLLEALNGDASLFTRSDGIETSWKLIDPIIQGWEALDSPPLHTYKKGSWGPAAADALLNADGRVWHFGCEHKKT